MTEFDWMLINLTVAGFIDGFLLATAIFLAVIARRLKKGRKKDNDTR